MNDVPVRYRIKSSQEILEVKNFGESFSDSNLVLVFRQNDLGFSRYAVIASKAVGGAVQRNRCKRRLRNRADRFIQNLAQDVDLLLIARLPLLSLTPKELDLSVKRLLTRAKLWTSE